MAREASNTPPDHHATPDLFGVSQLERFADLVRADAIAGEREAIISRLLEIGALEDGAFIEAIRARGNT
jgi:hypothetical protein